MVARAQQETGALTDAMLELQSHSQWIVRDAAKVPFNPLTGAPASAGVPSTWAGYLDARAALLRNDKYAGLGYEFLKTRGITGVDLDHCIDEHGNIDAWAQTIIDSLASYAEYSQSGEGVHIFTRASLLEACRHKFALKGERHEEAAIEIYDNKRYFAMTFKHVPGTPETIEPRQAEIDALYKRYAPPKQEQASHQERASYQPGASPSDLSDTELLRRASNARNGAKFDALWRGDISAYGGDDSRADLALCDLLAFWTGKDTQRMDSLFRLSGLMRDKWDRPTSGSTYGAITIGRACEHCTESYDPRSPREKINEGIERLERIRARARQKNNTDEHSTPFDDGDQEGTNDDNPAPEEKLPAIILQGQLRDRTRDCFYALENANKPAPRLFLYLTMPSKVTRDENGRPFIAQLTSAALRNELSDIADFFKVKKLPHGEIAFVPVEPPKDLADQLLAKEPGAWPCPPLKAIVEAPVLRPDGSILNQPGYDPITRLYYIPAPGMERCVIPAMPTREDAVKAMALLCDIFVDFPFEGESDRANTLALLFTPLVRYAVKKHVQMGLIDANNAGTGKGLLTDIVSIVATGEATTPMSAKCDEAEWRKTILAELLQGPRIVVIDNIRGLLESQAIELTLTGQGLNERILGQSKNAKPKNEATWIATGNNLLIGGDLPRRCYRIRLVSNTATPEERTDFKIPDLEQWVRDHRPEIVSAILTVARAWYVAGKPQPKNVPNLGTFTDWAKTVGGMLEFTGVEGFQGNREELRSRNNEEAQECAAFLEAWREEYAEEWKTAGEIVNDIYPAEKDSQQPPAKLAEALPAYLKKSMAEKRRDSFAVTFGNWLGKRVQTIYGTPGYCIDRTTDPHTKQKKWRVVRVVAGTATSQSQEKYTHSDSMSTPGGGDCGKHPQPPANGENGADASASDSPQSGSTGSFRPNWGNDGVAGGYAGGSKNAGVYTAGGATQHDSDDIPPLPELAPEEARRLYTRLAHNAAFKQRGSVLYQGDFLPRLMYFERLRGQLAGSDQDAYTAALAELHKRLAEVGDAVTAPA